MIKYVHGEMRSPLVLAIRTLMSDNESMARERCKPNSKTKLCVFSDSINIKSKFNITIKRNPRVAKNCKPRTPNAALKVKTQCNINIYMFNI